MAGNTKSRDARLSFGHPSPITIESPGEWDWNVWRREPHGDVWIGFFKDSGIALDWVKAQPHGNFVVNNVPPPTSSRYITGERKASDGYTPPVQPRFGAQSIVPARRTTKKAAGQSGITKGRTTRQKPVSQKERAARAAMQKQAAQRLDEVRFEEQADIEAGKTEGMQ